MTPPNPPALPEYFIELGSPEWNERVLKMTSYGQCTICGAPFKRGLRCTRCLEPSPHVSLNSREANNYPDVELWPRKPRPSLDAASTGDAAGLKTRAALRAVEELSTWIKKHDDAVVRESKLRNSGADEYEIARVAVERQTAWNIFSCAAMDVARDYESCETIRTALKRGEVD